MDNQTNIQITFITAVIGALIIILSFTILHFRNPQIEAKCMTKGGQVIATPGRISSCLYSPK